MNFRRYIQQHIISKLHSSGKAVLIYGPRQVGKTTLCKAIETELGLKTLYINADQTRWHNTLSSQDSRRLTELVSGYELVIIDEAQRVQNIGINLKILIDAKLPIKLIATGSSSFDLANKIQEPLTGRHWTYNLYPIAQLELEEHLNKFELNDALEERLVWGSYPELMSYDGALERRDYLEALTGDYLYKDLLTLQNIQHAGKLRDLVKMLAFQVGSLVSVSELASSIELNRETVARYLDLLEKTYVIVRLTGFSRNLRKEITKMSKFYFLDLGVRNSVIGNFNGLSDRDDVGALWENFLIMERIKRNSYKRSFARSFFWRTHTKAEVDYIETDADRINGYEITWSERGRKKAPTLWGDAYPNAEWEKIDRSNWLDFVL